MTPHYIIGVALGSLRSLKTQTQSLLELSSKKGLDKDFMNRQLEYLANDIDRCYKMIDFAARPENVNCSFDEMCEKFDK